MSVTSHRELLDLGASLFVPSEPCPDCGSIGEWVRQGDGSWACGACWHGMPADLDPIERHLWGLAKAAQAGGLVERIEHWEALMAYEAAMREGGVDGRIDGD